MFKSTLYVISSFFLWVIAIVMTQYALMVGYALYKAQPVAYHPWFNINGPTQIESDDGQTSDNNGTDSYDYETGYGTQN